MHVKTIKTYARTDTYLSVLIFSSNNSAMEQS